MNNKVSADREINLYYYIDRELSLEEKERLCKLREEAVRVIKTEFSFWQSGLRPRCGKEDQGEPQKNVCISDHCMVLRYAKDAGWATVVCRDFILEEQERRGEDTYFVSYAVEDLSAVDGNYLETVYCRCHQIPRLIADTERLFIREIAFGDLDDLMEIFDSNDKTKYFEAFYDHREDAAAFLGVYIKDVYQFYNYGIWGIYLKASGKMIGIAGFTPREGIGEKPVLELGYGVSKRYQNFGYAKEACKAIMEYAKDKLEYEEIITVTGEGERKYIAGARRTVIK